MILKILLNTRMGEMGDIYKIIEEHNRNKKRKISSVFDDEITDMFNNKTLCLIVTELSIGGRKVAKFLLLSSNLISQYQKTPD